MLAAGLSVVLAATMADWVAAPPAAAAVQPAAERASAGQQVLERPDEAAALVTARLTKKKVRIAGMTSETSEFWALPDGRVEAEVHLAPVRVRDGSGGWKPVDLTMVAQPDGSVAPLAHPYDLRLSGPKGEGSHELAAVGLGADRLSVGWAGALPAPSLDGNRATYVDALPGVDLVVEATREGVETFAVVKSRAAAAQVAKLTLPVTGRNAARYQRDQYGNMAIKDAKGRMIARSPAPEMWDARVDARGEPVNRVTVGSQVAGRSARSGRHGGLDVTLTPDMAWLTDPARSFPVTIDPQINPVSTTYDTYVRQNDTTENDGANDLQMGIVSGEVTRSFARWDTTALVGKQITSATMYFWNWWSPSCTAKSWELWTVGAIADGILWGNQPAWNYQEATSTATKGFDSTCNDNWVSISATSFFQRAANAGDTRADTGLRATSETDGYAFKQFRSRNAADSSQVPYAVVNYNSYPTVPSRATVPSTVCATGTSTPYINTKTPQLRAQISDAEGSQVKAEFEWATGGGTRIGGAIVGPGASGSWLATSVPAGAFAESGTYSWRVRGNDGTVNGSWSSYCAFIIDTTAPSATPTVSSSNYPEGQWAGGAGTAASFTFGASGVSDVTAYQYGLDVNPPNESVSAASLGGGASVSVPISNDGPHTLYVRSVDRAGNQSAIRSYQFNAGSAGLTAPKSGDITAAKTAITAVGSSGITSVTYQWRRGDADAWANIPASDVTKAIGGGTVTWPLASTGGQFEKLNWDVAKTLNDAEAGPDPLDGPVQLRGSFNGGAASSPVTITFDKNNATAATTSVGPCTVNLITGNCTLSDSDVSVDSYGSDLTVTRSFNTRLAGQTDSANMFGPGWVSGVAVEEADAPYTSLSRTGSLVQVGLPEGDTIGFAKKANITGGESFTPEIGMEDLKLTYTTASDSYTLIDLDGNTVAFTRVSGSPTGLYSPTAVTVPGSGQTTTISWESATVGGATVVRPTRMLAPVPDGVNCTTMTRGCRALIFSYATATTATGSTEAQWGDYLGRVKEISFTAWDPDLPTPAMRTMVMARYAYDTTGRLRASWDPRLDWTDEGGVHHLWDRYSYDADGVITTVTPNAQEPWQLSYTTLPADSGKGRLKAATRSALSAGTATSTIVYRVPTSGTGAPYDLSGAQTARWYQNEPPTDATAVFPATQIPDGDQAAGTLPSSWERATVSYLDANGRQVNTAQPGGHVSSTWYDQWSNITRTLTAGNRKLALDASATDTASQESDLARARSSLNTYSSDGQRLTLAWGPEHDVMLPDGVVVRGRNVTRNTYDEGAPTTGGPYNLVTTEQVGVRWYPNGVETDTDVRITTTAYDWTLRQPTVVTVDPAGLAQATRTSYDPITGLVTSTTAPAGGTSTTTPATRKTIYYRATSGSGYTECDLKPEWANLPCRVQPGGQAASGPELPVTVTTYDMFNEPRVATEKTSAGTLRTTTTTWDGAGRSYETSVTAAAGLGTAVPITRNVYDQATGQLLRTQSVVAGAVTAEVIRAYDTLGRLTSYTDADGVTSTTTYDLLGRMATSNDGKAGRTYTYDGGTERRGLLTSVSDAQAGAFSGSYDADGNLVSESWPNGVQVSAEINEAGAQVGLTYVKPGCAATDCTLYQDSVSESVHGEWREHVSTLSEQSYTYDQAGRLTSVRDAIGGLCTTRSYGLSTSSNRTSLEEYAPAGDGSCQTTTAASSRTWTYDTADRVTSTGYAYDALGRTTAVPAADTGNSAGGDVTATYHVTDMVDTINQNGRTTDYTIDVIGTRIRSWSDDSGGTAVQRVNHYGGDGDRPSWTQETSTAFSRPISGLSGMTGSFDGGTGQITWRMTNLHGDLIAEMDSAGEGLSRTSEYTEYGGPRDAASAGTDRYGWLGVKQRAADTPPGIMLMGVRLYNPVTGRFLQVDPIYAGSCNAYDYTCADPINRFDIGGFKEVDDGGYSNSCKCTSKNKKWRRYKTTSWSTSRWYDSSYNQLPKRLKAFIKDTIARYAGYGVVTIDNIKYQYRTRHKIYRRCKGGQWEYRWDRQEQERVRTVLSIVFWGDQTITSRWGSGSASG